MNDAARSHHERLAPTPLRCATPFWLGAFIATILAHLAFASTTTNNTLTCRAIMKPASTWSHHARTFLNMSYVLRNFVFCLAFLFPLSRAYCDNAHEIVGKWESIEITVGAIQLKPKKGAKPSVTEFRKDGTFSAPKESGTYSFPTDGTILVGSKNYKIRIVRNTMVHTETGEKDPKLRAEIKYRRVQ